MVAGAKGAATGVARPPRTTRAACSSGSGTRPTDDAAVAAEDLAAGLADGVGLSSFHGTSSRSSRAGCSGIARKLGTERTAAASVGGPARHALRSPGAAAGGGARSAYADSDWVDRRSRPSRRASARSSPAAGRRPRRRRPPPPRWASPSVAVRVALYHPRVAWLAAQLDSEQRLPGKALPARPTARYGRKNLRSSRTRAGRRDRPRSKMTESMLAERVPTRETKTTRRTAPGGTGSGARSRRRSGRRPGRRGRCPHIRAVIAMRDSWSTRGTSR